MRDDMTPTKFETVGRHNTIYESNKLYQKVTETISAINAARIIE